MFFRKKAENLLETASIGGVKSTGKMGLEVHLCRAWEVIRVYNVVNRKGRHKLQAIQDLSRGEA